MKITRKQFLKHTAVAGGAVVIGVGCSDDSGGRPSRLDGTSGGTDGSATADGGSSDTGSTAADTGGGSPDTGGTIDTGVVADSEQSPDTSASTCSDTQTQISSNHNHAVTIPAADVLAGKMKTYNIKGGSGHPHEITLTAANFGTLASGSSVTVKSTKVSGHTHDVKVDCV